MGSSSKVLLVGATSLIVGVYAISLKNVQTTNMKAAQAQVNRMQNERLLDGAIVLVLDKVKKSGGNVNETVTGKQALGCDISYAISNADGAKVDISVTVTKGEVTKRIYATAEKVDHSKGQVPKRGYRKMHRGDWQITRMFSKRG